MLYGIPNHEVTILAAIRRHPMIATISGGGNGMIEAS